MSQHWTDREKGRAVDGFSNAQERRIMEQPEVRPPQAPQPQLTPNGPMRRQVDNRVREQMAADLARKKEEIMRKFEQDRQKEMQRIR